MIQDYRQISVQLWRMLVQSIPDQRMFRVLSRDKILYFSNTESCEKDTINEWVTAIFNSSLLLYKELIYYNTFGETGNYNHIGNL
jgi:hypothetical protein